MSDITLLTIQFLFQKQIQTGPAIYTVHRLRYLNKIISYPLSSKAEIDRSWGGRYLQLHV